MSKILVGLNAGHGGRDTGARHRELNRTESMLNLEVAYAAASAIAWSPFVEPVLIRQGDHNLTNAEANGIAKRAGCDVVIDIHFNSCKDPSRHGGLILHRENDKLGRAIGVEVISNLGRDWRSHPANYLYDGVLAYPDAYAITEAYEMPCALVEIAFLSSAIDREWLKRNETIDDIARAFRKGCDDWTRLDFIKELL